MGVGHSGELSGEIMALIGGGVMAKWVIWGKTLEFPFRLSDDYRLQGYMIVSIKYLTQNSTKIIKHIKGRMVDMWNKIIKQLTS